MNKILIFIFMILVCDVAKADVYVITDQINSVYSLSEADDAVAPSGYKKNIIKNKMISDLPISMGEEKLYDFEGNKFTLNSKRLQEKKDTENESALKKEKYKSDKESTIKKLKELSFTDDEILVIIE